MKNEETEKLVFLVLVTGRKQKDAILCALLETGVQLTNIIYGRGTVKASYLMNVLGLVSEENKAVITCVLADNKSDTVLKMLIEKFHFDKSNTGIAFTTPIDKLSF